MYQQWDGRVAIYVIPLTHGIIINFTDTYTKKMRFMSTQHVKLQLLRRERLSKHLTLPGIELRLRHSDYEASALMLRYEGGYNSCLISSLSTSHRRRQFQ